MKADPRGARRKNRKNEKHKATRVDGGQPRHALVRIYRSQQRGNSNERQATVIQLGDRVKDTISGISGIVIGKTDWLYGCRRIQIQPEESKDGKPADSFSVDEPQCKLVKAGVIARAVPAGDDYVAPSRRTHGPSGDVARRPDPRR